MAKFNPAKYVPLPPESFAERTQSEPEAPAAFTAPGGYQADFARWLKQGRIGGPDDEDS